MSVPTSGSTWKIDLGGGRCLAVAWAPSDGYYATLDGFRGSGSTQEIALDDLLACMRRYCEAADDLERALAPGGRLHEKLLQISSLVDQIVEEQR